MNTGTSFPLDGQVNIKPNDILTVKGWLLIPQDIRERLMHMALTGDLSSAHDLTVMYLTETSAVRLVIWDEVPVEGQSEPALTVREIVEVHWPFYYAVLFFETQLQEQQRREAELSMGAGI